MEERLTMNHRELERLTVIRSVLKGQMTWTQAAEQLGLCRRQVGYLCTRVRAEGPRGIMHHLRGRPSKHQLPAGRLDRALGLLKQPRYEGFGPTLACEKLVERYGFHLSVWTLRRGMIQAGLWHPRKSPPRHRAWRERRPQLGMLVQLDGSEHAWFEGRGPRCVLVLFIDDATSRILYGEFVKVEDTLTLLRVTRTYLLRHGRPWAFYVDKDSIYKVNRQATVEEALRDSQPMTQFARAMAELGIRVICANSPQAKGRVERSFGTHQDRLVKELRLAGISQLPQANHFLWTVYVPQHNARFAVDPRQLGDAHRPLLPRTRLDDILNLRTERVLANDYTLRIQNRFFQILPDQPVRLRPGATLRVDTRLDGSVQLWWKDQALRFKPLAHKPYAPLAIPKYRQGTRAAPPRQPYRPSRKHPWRTYAPAPAPRFDETRTA